MRAEGPGESPRNLHVPLFLCLCRQGCGLSTKSQEASLGEKGQRLQSFLKTNAPAKGVSAAAKELD